MVNEDAAAMLKARGRRPIIDAHDGEDTQQLPRNGDQECVRSLICAQDTPWDWPEGVLFRQLSTLC
jgi:hypothetical protein